MHKQLHLHTRAIDITRLKYGLTVNMNETKTNLRCDIVKNIAQETTLTKKNTKESNK